MPTQQDTFINEDYLNETLGTTVTGGELISEDLQSDNVLSFDGVNDYIDTGSTSVGNYIHQDKVFTISVWAKIEDIDQNNVEALIGSTATTAAKGFWLAYEDRSVVPLNNGLRIVIVHGSAGQSDQLRLADVVEDTDWHHWVVTGDGTTIKGYIDGELNPTTEAVTYTGITGDATNNLNIGRYNHSSPGGYLHGNISQVALFDYGLTQSQVTDLYKYGYDNAQSLQPATNYWPLNDGSTADDSIGGVDGTINGATWGDGSIYTLESRTTSDDKLGSTDTPTSITDFKYTTSKKGGGVGARMGFSQDYDVQRENVLSFDGVDDVINNPIDAIGTGDYSISVWFKTLEGDQMYLTSPSENIAGGGIDYSFPQVRAVPSASFVWLQCNANGALTIPHTNNTEWNHVVFTRTGGTITGYMNGEDQTVSTTGSDHSQTGIDFGATDFDVQKFEFASTEYFRSGWVGDLRVYDDVLTADEVNFIYTSGKEGTDPTTTNLVSQWLLDEGTGTTATDNAGSNNGTITSATWATDTDIAHITSTWKNANNDTVVRGAYSFDGVNDNIEVDGLVSTISSDTFGTWCAWIKVDSFDASGGRIIALGDTNAIGYLELSTTTSGELQASARSSSGVQWDIESDEILVVGKRYHVTLVQDGTEPVLYINGSLAPSAFAVSTDKTVWATDLSAQLDNAYIGDLSFNSNGLGTYTWDGEISDVQVYDAALTPTEIWDIYANSKPRATNQVSRWKLNGNALDEWGANDGTVSGALPLPARANTPVVGDSLNQRSIASFDGVNDYVEDEVQLVTDYPFTMGGWFKTSGSVGNQVIISLTDRSTNKYSMTFRLHSTGYMALWTDDDTTGEGLISTKTRADDGKWHHGMVVYASDTDRRVYLDGVENVSSVVSIDYNSANIDNWAIGSQVDNLADSFFNGEIANIAFYNDARTASEILTDYENGYIDETDANLVSYWPLDGDYLDWKGSNDGTNNGSTIVKAIDGPMGKRNFGHNDVLSFDGVDDYVEVPHDASLDTNTAMSISVWAKVAVSGALDVIVDKRVGAGNRSWTIEKSATDLYSFSIRKSDDSTWVTVGSINIASDTWTHIVGTFDGSNLRLYVDGTLEDTDSSYSGTIQAGATSPLKIGATANSPDGHISNVALYNDALTADEIKYIYTNGNQGTDPTTTNLVSQWLLDEGTGTTATDNAGSNDGTITGATWDKGLVPPMNLNNQVTMDVTSLSATDTIFVRAYMDNLIERSTSPVAFAEWTIEYLAAGGIVSENSLFFGTMF